MGNWIFTIKIDDETKERYFQVGFIVNSNGSFNEAIRVGDIISAVRLTNILNGGNATIDEIVALTTLKES